MHSHTVTTASSTTQPQLSHRISASPSSDSSPLLTVDRQSLSLTLQLLPWRDTRLQLTRLCRALPPLDAGDFRCDQVILEGKRIPRFDDYGLEWQRYNWCNQVATFCVRRRLQRLFSHVRHLSLTATHFPCRVAS